MFGVTPPWYQNPIEWTAFGAYAQRQQDIEDFISALIKTSNPNDERCQHGAASFVGLDMDSLTPEEISYIESEVAKRWQS